jgi:flagellar motor switch protein FliG
MSKKGFKDALNGKEKAAMLLISLGPDASAEIFKYLNEEEIEQLTLEIANIRKVSSELRDDVINEFYQICLAQDYIMEGGITYAKDILEKALGPEEALNVLNRLTVSLQVRPFDFVRKTEPAQLLNFIQYEHPQTIALILSYLNSNQSSVLLSALPTEKQGDVARRIAKMDRTSPDVIKEVEKVLEKKLSSVVSQDYTSVGGIEAIVEILNSVDRGTEKHIMESLEIDDTDLAEEIKKRMFVFEDILLLDNRSVQRFLRDVENSMLVVALKGSTEEVKELIFANMSSRVVESLREDIEFMGPVRLKDVEEAQQKIVNVIRKLEEAGEIIISRGGGDELIV